MKNCLKVPRLTLPVDEFESWAVIAGEANKYDRSFWENTEKAVGKNPSAYRFMIPDALLGEAREDAAEEIRRRMYRGLEKSDISKLRRGGMYVRRKTKYGYRQGVLLCVDLEEFTYKKGESSIVRASQQFERTYFPFDVALRRRAILEFPHTIVFYFDKKSKVNDYLKENDLETIYDFELMQDGGSIKGDYIPEDDCRYVSKLMHTRGEPCFTVAEGEREIAAAKAHWEELKGTLTEREQAIHPARYLLAEFVNFYDDAVKLLPVHRLLTDIEPDAFCDFFTKGVKCTRKDNVLYPAIKNQSDYDTCAALVNEFLQKNGGRVQSFPESLRAVSRADDCGVAIVFPEIEKKDYLSWMKEGVLLPENTFTIGKERYLLEGREISYD